MFDADDRRPGLDVFSDYNNPPAGQSNKLELDHYPGTDRDSVSHRNNIIYLLFGGLSFQ